MHFLTLNISAQAVTTISPNFNQSRALDKNYYKLYNK